MNATHAKLTDGLSGDGSLDWRAVALARYHRLLADLGDIQTKQNEAELLHTILTQAGQLDLPPIPWAAMTSRRHRGPNKPKTIAGAKP